MYLSFACYDSLTTIYAPVPMSCSLNVPARDSHVYKYRVLAFVSLTNQCCISAHYSFIAHCHRELLQSVLILTKSLETILTRSATGAVSKLFATTSTGLSFVLTLMYILLLFLSEIHCVVLFYSSVITRERSTAGNSCFHCWQWSTFLTISSCSISQPYSRIDELLLDVLVK